MNHLLRRTAPAAVATLLSAGLLAGCGSKATDDAADAGTPTSPATTASAPTTAPTSAPTSPSTAVGEPAAPALVYFVTTTPRGARLTGEETQVDPTADTLVAVQSATPVDPDYRNLVPKGSLASAQAGDGEITIALTKSSFATTKLSAADAKLAVQQVVYSANAANGTAAKPLPVHFVSQSGADSTYLGQPSVEKPGTQLATLALMSVLSPVDGSTLPATRTTFSGVGSSFEATVGWKITDASGKSVLHGSTMSAGWMDKLYPWKATVDLSQLPAGSYTFTASTDDASEGEGGGPFTDTKTFTVG